ncbi:multidrug DMT transporter [Erwinia sp. OLTSP20]|uniref:DMT family transporter n=1 Tax=unclassified Erwinia TaxID=2622719 RepID=UPI000C596565|nr:multidrug DMT transporter [Erwinia sp. OLSSP12]PIJ80645.1 multidrug DMT transporter [Erwinia sp. OLCASP19]PIJ82797.1 multidrug DMT transporter [Erwinia sp. OLMTSP26]PIJ85482.1 multidrug DMT transporter [Erwinia sp. OLMDSP33]PIJ92240.1 multidrug DMT transporter [Erwinia sp. OLTSP20]PIJ93309.1 multidrug DMT transporter [Erwinia sp. OLFS4]
MKIYLLLLISVAAETVATSMVKASDGFTRLVPSLIVVIGYGISFYGLSHVVKVLNLGVAYAIWAGLGIILVSMISYFYYHQKLDLPAIVGITFIIAGVVIINLFSASMIEK